MLPLPEGSGTSCLGGPLSHSASQHLWEGSGTSLGLGAVAPLDPGHVLGGGETGVRPYGLASGFPSTCAAGPGAFAVLTPTCLSLFLFHSAPPEPAGADLR